MKTVITYKMDELRKQYNQILEEEINQKVKEYVELVVYDISVGKIVDKDYITNIFTLMGRDVKNIAEDFL